MNDAAIKKETYKFSKLLSSVFCSTAVTILAVLSLLNSMSIDFYSMLILLKTVIPGGFSFWFIGLMIGKILDAFDTKIIKTEKLDEEKAYAIPSIFGTNETDLSSMDDLDDIM